MKIYNRIVSIAMSLSLFGSSALAELPSELKDVVFTGSLYGRSTVDFRKKANNVTSLIPENSEASVLETRRLRSGAYGIKIHINKLGDGQTKAKVGDEVWVYYSQKDPWLSFKDRDDEDVDDPEVALTAQAKRDGEGIPVPGTVADPTLPTQEDVLKDQKPEKPDDPNLAKSGDKTKTEAGFCETCAEHRPTPDTKNQKDIKDVSNAVAADAEAKKPERDHSHDNAAAGKWNNFPEVMKYSEGSKVTNAIKYGMRNKHAHSRKECYKSVKKSLLAGGVVKSYPQGGHAREAVRYLKAQGMINMLDDPKYKNLIKSPADAPKGAAIVYWNGTSESGDIQIKTDWGSNGGYISDFYNNRTNGFLDSPKARRYAREGKPYKIIGVMIKP